MLEFCNQSSWAGGLYPGWDRKRRPQVTAVFKAGFQFDLEGRVTPLAETPPVIAADVHHGKALETSLREVNEIAPFKQGSEVYLYGVAYPASPDQRIAEVVMEIMFPHGETFRKVLHVFGKRYWKRQMMHYIASKPEPLTPTPLIYENAFGGVNPGNPEEGYPRNPVGKGLNGRGWDIFNPELPCIEQGPYFITSPSHKPSPAGFGPLPVFWQPRVDEYGKVPHPHEQHKGCPWGEEAEPVLHNVAPCDQRFRWLFSGGEIIQLSGFFPELSRNQLVRFVIPALTPQLRTIIDGDSQPQEPKCDTLVIDTEKRVFYLVWRAGITWSLLDPRKGWVVLKDGSRNQEGTDGKNQLADTATTTEART